MRWRWVLPLVLLAGTAHAQTGPAPAFPHADGTDCTAGNFPRGMDEEGNAELCTAISAVGGAIVIEENNVTVEALATGLDFLGDDFDLLAVGGGEVDISLAHDYLKLIGGDLDRPGHLSIAGRLHMTGTKLTVSAFSTGCAAACTVVNTIGAHGLANGQYVVINGSTNYDGEKVISNVSSTAFEIAVAFVSDQVPATYRMVGKFALADSTPDVSTGSWWRTSNGSEFITDFDWSGADPPEYGQLLFIRSVDKTTFQCGAPGTGLSCGTQALATTNGDFTVWISKERENSGETVSWTLLHYSNAKQSYSGLFVKQTDSRMFGFSNVENLRINQEFDLGLPRFFDESDTAPDVAQGTTFRSWECNDDYSEHCIDLYNSEFGGPCIDSAGQSGNVQCSGNPDTKCDFDGFSVVNTGTQRAPPIHDSMVRFRLHGLSPLLTIVIDDWTDVDAENATEIVRMARTTDYDGDYTACIDYYDDAFTPQVGCVGPEPFCPDFRCDVDRSAIELGLITDEYTSVVDAGAFVQFTTDVAHQMEELDYVIIGGYGHGDYNGTWQITSVTSTTFQIPIADFTSTETGYYESRHGFILGATWTNDQLPHVATYSEPDLFCDADGSTAYTTAKPAPVTIDRFNFATGNQLIYVVTATDEDCVDLDDGSGGPPDGLCDSDDTTPLHHVTYDCETVCTDLFDNTYQAQQTTGSPDGVCDADGVTLVANTPHLICGSSNIQTLEDYTATWLRQEATGRWQLLGLETFSDAVKAGLQSDNYFRGVLNDFTLSTLYLDTQAPLDSSLKGASTAYVDAAVAAGGGGGGSDNSGRCSLTFTTESAADTLMCGKANGALTLDALNCTALGGTTPVSQAVEVVECTSAGATCAGSGGTIVASAVETNYVDAAFVDNSIDDNDWWGVKLNTFTTRADYLECYVDFTRAITSRECSHVFTTESATDVIFCGKADGAQTLSKINCTALGGTAPVAQIVEVVECDANGGSCVGSGGTITAAAVETDYEDATFTDNTVDDNDWWGIKLASFTTRADYLDCQVEYVTP